MPYNPKKHGKAEYSRFVQLPKSVTSGMVEGGDDESYDDDTKYADLVYNLAPSTLNLSGDIAIDSVGIDDTGSVKISGDQLKVFDQGVIDTIVEQNTRLIDELSGVLIDKNFSRIIQTRDNGTYFAHAKPGTDPSESKWRVQKIDENGSRSWANGSDAFNQVANIELSGLSYSY